MHPVLRPSARDPMASRWWRGGEPYISHLLQSSLVRCGQYSRTAGPPSVLNLLTVAVSFAVGFWIRSNNSSPLQQATTQRLLSVPPQVCCGNRQGSQPHFSVFMRLRVDCRLRSESRSLPLPALPAMPGPPMPGSGKPAGNMPGSILGIPMGGIPGIPGMPAQHPALVQNRRAGQGWFHVFSESPCGSCKSSDT